MSNASVAHGCCAKNANLGVRRGVDVQVGLAAGSVDEARRKLNIVLVTAELALRVLDKAPEFGDDAAMAGVEEVFGGLAHALTG